ncbi:MAG TPA: glycosyltransferase family 4 protein [Burkholderiales bacterium]|nr:glycosyltransferase family 4 protein [Burkholderiales bacterium]
MSTPTRTALTVYMLGLRGFPNVQGGVETHAQNLCPLLAQMGCDVHVLARASYQPPHPLAWQGVRFHRLWAPRHKGLEALLHSLLCVFYAAFKRPDILHVQAIGPALITPLARLLGLRVVVTHHGPDYERQKWGAFARWVLRLGEGLGMRNAHGRIAVSHFIAELIRNKYAKEATSIPNGVCLPTIPTSTATLHAFGLEANRYVLLVSRLVAEKRHFDLIEAFAAAQLPGWKLVLVGAADHPDAYTRALLERAASAPDVVCTGFQSGEALAELYAHAGLFVLPSSHEGLPIALLEALSYGLPALASDIPANLELRLPSSHYFPLGNVEALAARMREFAASAWAPEARTEQREWVKQRFCWIQAAKQTLEIYRAAAREKESPQAHGVAQP